VAHFGLAFAIFAVVAAAYVMLPSKQIRINSVKAATDGHDIKSVTAEQSVVVKGVVSNSRIRQVVLDVNGSRRPVSVDNGAFESRLTLLPGKNRIQAAISPGGLGFAGSSETVQVVALIPPADIWAELTWEGSGDIDLHLILPDSEKCWFQNLTTKAGATLDYDNTVQDGPEHITMAQALPGTYTLEVVYFADHGLPRRVPWMVKLRLKNGAIQQTYSGVLENKDAVKTITFSLP
jgi:uncharacterized protein YfaP (DUF2135 family)